LISFFYTDEPPLRGVPSSYRRDWGEEKVVIPPVAEKRIAMAWEGRISIPVTRPGFWMGDPWVAGKSDEGWVSIELEGKGCGYGVVGGVVGGDTSVLGSKESTQGEGGGDGDLMS